MSNRIRIIDGRERKDPITRLLDSVSRAVHELGELRERIGQLDAELCRTFNKVQRKLAELRLARNKTKVKGGR